MKRTFVAPSATLCMLLGCAASCEPREAPKNRGPWVRIDRPAGCDGTTRCPTLDPRDHSQYGGADILITGCVVEALDDVALDVSWPITAGSRHVFEWAGTVRQHDVFPLHGAVARHLGCYYGHPPAFPGPDAEIDLSPDGASWAVPAPDNVFLTLGDGEVLLDHDFRVQASLDAPTDDTATWMVTVGVEQLAGRGRRYGPLHLGDSFPWGPLRATIVRAVRRAIQRGNSFAGWVEVSLSASPAAGAGAD